MTHHIDLTKEPLDWREHWITWEYGRDEEGTKQYVAWTEDYTELGRYETWNEAAAAVEAYAKTLEGAPK